MPAVNNINPGLKTLAVKIDSLKLDPRNARKHGDRSITAIMSSLMQFGQQKPIVVAQGVVCAGNGTLEAAKRLGWDEIAAVEFHHEKKHSGAYALADNRTAELSEWDFPELSSQMELFGQDGQLELSTMWSPDEIGNLKAADWVTPQPPQDGEAPVDTELVRMTGQQFAIVQKAIYKLRALGGHEEWSDGMCLALIAERSL